MMTDQINSTMKTGPVSHNNSLASQSKQKETSLENDFLAAIGLSGEAPENAGSDAKDTSTKGGTSPKNLDAYEIVPDNSVGPLEKNQISQTQYDDLLKAGFDKYDVVPNDFKGELLPNQMRQSEYDAKVEQFLETPKLEEAIELIKKVEAAHPNASGEEILNGLRKLANYDTLNFQKMYGTQPGMEIKPTGNLTQADIDNLKGMIRHETDANGDEKGNVRGPNGEFFSLGHVLTGISAGQHRDGDFSFAPLFGEEMDNLYAVTIGDLGQSAALINDNQNVGTGNPYTYIGPNTEATYPELRGDIHGWVIGDNLSDIIGNRSLYSNGLSQSPGDPPPISVSEILDNCYISKTSPVNYDNFNDIFHRDALGELGSETEAFAETYSYKDEVRGKVGGIFSFTDKEATEAVNEFNDWFDQER